MSTIVNFPDNLFPTSISGMNLKANNLLYQSNYSRATDTHRLFGDQWNLTLNFENIDNMNGYDEIAKLQSFIWSLGGVSGRFLMSPFIRVGAPSKGTPVVNGNSQTGNSLNTDGWLSSAKVLRQGDFFQIGYELKMVTEDIWSDSLGDATLKFTPPLRNSPVDNDPIVTDDPKGLFRLKSDDQGQFDLSPGLEAEVSIQVVEAFDVL